MWVHRCATIMLDSHLCKDYNFNMPPQSDDDDDFLYGSDENEQPVQKKQKTAPSVEVKETALAPSKNENDDSDEEEDSDDDIEFVIGDTGSKPSTATTSSGTHNDTIDAVTDAEDQNKSNAVVAKDSSKPTTVDVNAVAELDGKPLTQVDLEKLKDKPWRFPGADISDYFNYGFDEFSWTAYCCKQDKLRGEFNPQKLMAQLMGGGGPPPKPNGQNNNGNMAPPMGMPPMGMMPGMPPGMPPMGMMPPGMPMPNFNNRQGGNFVPPPPPPGRR